MIEYSYFCQKNGVIVITGLSRHDPSFPTPFPLSPHTSPTHLSLLHSRLQVIPKLLQIEGSLFAWPDKYVFSFEEFIQNWIIDDYFMNSRLEKAFKVIDVIFLVIGRFTFKDGIIYYDMVILDLQIAGLRINLMTQSKDISPIWEPIHQILDQGLDNLVFLAYSVISTTAVPSHHSHCLKGILYH